MLTSLKESNDVFMACRDDNRFCTTGMLRYAIMAASMSSNTRRTQRPADINSKLHHDNYVNNNNNNNNNNIRNLYNALS